MQKITTPLPREKIREIEIRENGEPLVAITESEKLILLREHKYLSPLLRTSVRDRLVQAANSLPDGYKLLIVTAYRPITMQRELYRNRLRQMAKAHPFQMIFLHWRWKRIVRQYTSPPGGSSHQCGAAIDVTILDKDGNRLDMGTSFNDFGEKVHTYSSLISDEQKKNRMMILELMAGVGFVNYPMEWWHYSYGDRMWAAYSGEKECFYGPLKKE